MSDVPASSEPAGVVQRAARQYWWLPVVRGALAIIFGLIAVIWPHITAGAILWVVAIFAIVDGIVAIYDAIRYRSEGGTALGVTLGAVAVIFGIIALVWPGPTITVFAVIVGIWAIVAGLIQLVASIDLRSVIGSGWGWGMVTGSLTIVLGLLLLFWPKSSVAALVVVLGIWAFVVGLLLIAIGFQVRRVGKGTVTV
jgi:uncharacterized membrane protein HdeD (DUF308 family)